VSGQAAANGQGAFDLDAAAKAAAAEAEGEPFRFTWCNESYEVPPALEWPLSAMTLLAAGDLPNAMSELLGADAYTRLAATGITIGTLNTLFDAIGRAAGLGGLPNSSSQPRPASTRT
jgi:hypothetical protein